MRTIDLLKTLDNLSAATDVDSVFAALCPPLIEKLLFFDHLLILKAQQAPLYRVYASTLALYQDTLWSIDANMQAALSDGPQIIEKKTNDTWINVQSVAVAISINSLLLVQINDKILMFSRKRDPSFNAKDGKALQRFRPLLAHSLQRLHHFIPERATTTGQPSRGKRNNERFKIYAELATDWFWESDENLNYRVLLGYQKKMPAGFELLKGKTLFDLRSANEVRQLKKWNHFLYLTNRHLPFKNFEFEIALGRMIRWISISGQPTFFADGAFKGYLGTATDISYIKQREAELNKAKKVAESANAAKSQFIAVMSHELRTPLNVVLGNLELLLQMDLSKEQIDMLNYAQTSTKLLQVLISDVLDMSKIEAGTIDLEKTRVNPAELVNDVVCQFNRQADAKGLSLHVSIGKNVPPQVTISAMRVAQVLFNLIGNAIKFTEQGSIEVFLEAQGQKLVFSVKDTGCGISDTEKEKVFLPFEQLDLSSKKRREGAGLGLSISQRLVNLMQGSIKFTSAVNQGTTFTFFIPILVEQEAAQCPEDKDAPATRLAPLNILVAEDHLANQMLMKAMLTQRGHQVSIVADGLQAVKAVDNTPFDLVLMDMVMPEMTGVEATKEIRKRPQHSDLPIIALTANVSVDDRKTCAQAGMSDFLTKPLTGQALDQALHKWAK